MFITDRQPASRLLVLLAEDEPIIRIAALDLLNDAGFTVLEATHAEEALALLRAQADAIHVLFTDIHMPGAIDGMALARHAREHWPWIGILITSGRARPTAVELPAGSRFVPKPYNPYHIVGHVQELASGG